MSESPYHPAATNHQPFVVSHDDGQNDHVAYAHNRGISHASPPPPLYDPPISSSNTTGNRNSRDSGDSIIDESGLNRDVFEKDVRFLAEREMEEGAGIETGEEGYHYPHEGGGYRQFTSSSASSSHRQNRSFLLVLLGIIVTAALIGSLSASSFRSPVYSKKNGNKHIEMDHLFNGTFSVKSQRLDWVKEAGDGVYSTRTHEGDIVLEDVTRNRTRLVLVNASEVVDAIGAQLDFQDWRLSADMKYIMLKRDYRKLWRHSSYGNYYIHRLSDHITFPLSDVVTPSQVNLVSWSSVGHNIAYVLGNDVYVVEASELDRVAKNTESTPRHTQVTFDGSANIINGVNSWVYEEEVLQTSGALWWNPLGNAVAFLKQDETLVKNYTLQYYNKGPDAFVPHPYPENFVMKYPVPGTPNPITSVWIYQVPTPASGGTKIRPKKLSWTGQLPSDDQVIMSVDWVGDHDLLVKETDRASKVGHAVFFSDDASDGDIVRTLGQKGEEGDNGWIDHNQHIELIQGDVTGYLDIVANADGYNHVALFSPADSSTPVWITEGDWEVTGGIASWDEKKGLIYFLAANPSTERHLYSAKVPDQISSLAEWQPEMTAMTDTSQPGYYDVSFSPHSGYYSLSYRGPDIPWQRLINTEKQDVEFVLEDNAALNATSSQYCKPLINYETVLSDDFELNVVELLPPNFDSSGHRHKYPVLFNPYGGPGSQSVDARFKRDWHHYLACEKKYIIVTVDGRGTGFKGRKLRNPIRDRLGEYESRDQINIAREWAKKRYVDTHKIGIWGWSFGGYLTAKVLEADSGIFTLGMAVAPVTDWRYYDSIYTERFMSLPEDNEVGYNHTAINNVTSFNNADFLLAHGTGDDNVHYANTASLLDKFTVDKVRNFRFRMFTDSDHSINVRGAYRELYEFMTDFLEEKWGKRHKVQK